MDREKNRKENCFLQWIACISQHGNISRSIFFI